ncbi:MAG: Fe-S protein assembly co-chaperone HscB [Bacteroidia bacterium]
MNPFETFGLEPSFALDLQALRKKYISLQREVHPDVQGGSDEQSEWLNKHYEILKDDLLRARCLLEMHGKQEREFPLPAIQLMAWMEMGDWVEENPTQAESEFEVLEQQLLNQKNRLIHEANSSFSEAKLEELAHWIQGESYRRRLRKIHRGEREL